MRQTTGEKQTFLVQAKSYKTISGSDWAAMLCWGLMTMIQLRRSSASASVESLIGQFVSGSLGLMKLMQRVERMREVP
jgi:hypothetical protein